MRWYGKLYPWTVPFLKFARGNRQIIRWIFGIRIPPTVAAQYDPTTVLLSKVLKRQRRSETERVLELGIGTAALVGLSLAKRSDVTLHGVDLMEERVSRSQQVAQYNQVDAEFWQSDLFAEVESKPGYDVVIFNPPYVPSDVGRSLRLTERMGVEGEHVWNGGRQGDELLRKFLSQVSAYLTERGRVIFGVQPIFLNDGLVRAAIEDSGLHLQETVRDRWIHSVVYIAVPADRVALPGKSSDV